MKSKALYVTEFTVTGARSFPVAMLRYDMCKPVDEYNATLASNSGDFETEMQKPIRAIRMAFTTKSAREHKLYAPTVARWNSFGWTVNAIKKEVL
jgi:hypothetical protein